MTVVEVSGSEGASGLATMVGTLIEQNLERDPGRVRTLRASVACLSATDAGVSITIRIAPGHVEISDGPSPGAHLTLAGDGERLLFLTTAPLRFGLPDALDARGRAALRDIFGGRVRITGMLRHPRRLARLASLLSVA